MSAHIKSSHPGEKSLRELQLQRRAIVQVPAEEKENEPATSLEVVRLQTDVLLWKPTNCRAGGECHITDKDIRRRHLYSSSGLKVVEVQRWYCTNHNAVVTLTTPHVLQQLQLANRKLSPSCLILPGRNARMLTTEFVSMMLTEAVMSPSIVAAARKLVVILPDSIVDAVSAKEDDQSSEEEEEEEDLVALDADSSNDDDANEEETLDDEAGTPIAQEDDAPSLLFRSQNKMRCIARFMTQCLDVFFATFSLPSEARFPKPAARNDMHRD